MQAAVWNAEPVGECLDVTPLPREQPSCSDERVVIGIAEFPLQMRAQIAFKDRVIKFRDIVSDEDTVPDELAEFGEHGFDTWCVFDGCLVNSVDASACARDVPAWWFHQSIKLFNAVADGIESLRANLNDLGNFRVNPCRLQIIDNHVRHVRALKAAD